jgi:cytochrome c oxidase subunit 3
VRRRYFVPDLAQVGVALGIISISAFFIALVVAYAFRIEDQRTWTRFSVPHLLWFSTAILISSSVTFEAARHSLRHGIVRAYRKRMAATIVFAVIFLVTQVGSAQQMIAQGVSASGNPHGSAFYVFMGLHGIHLLGGLAALAVLWRRAARVSPVSEQALRKHRRLADAIMLYWHFMGVLWIVLFYFLLRWTNA